MASPPSEERGQIVLDIYAHFKSEPGDVLLANNFIAVATRRHIRIADLQGGLNFATEAGWIENGPNGSLRLTPAGFERMRQRQAVP